VARVHIGHVAAQIGLARTLENTEPQDAELTVRVRGQFRRRGIGDY
jgi:hypothetical protein